MERFRGVVRQQLLNFVFGIVFEFLKWTTPKLFEMNKKETAYGNGICTKSG